MNNRAESVNHIVISVPYRVLLSAIAVLIPIAAWVIATRTPWTVLRDRLMHFNPVYLDWLLLASVTAVLLNAGDIWQAVQRISRQSLTILLVIALSAGLLSALLAPRTNRLYYDEQIYQNIGQNMALAGLSAMCNEGQYIYDEYYVHSPEYNKQPYGYPHLLGTAYRLFGVHEIIAHIANNICALAAVVIAFFLGWWCCHSERAGLFAALSMTVIPQQLLWCNTASAEPTTMVSAGAAMLALAYYITTPSVRRLSMAVVMLAYSVYFRPESILVLIAAASVVLLCGSSELRQRRFYLGLVVLAVLIVPEIVHLAAVRNEGWGSPGGNKFTLAAMEHNLFVNGFFYVRNKLFPVSVTLGAAIAIAMVWSWPALRRKWGFLVWALLLWGVFLTFYAGSYDYGVDVRFSLVSYLPLAILSGVGYYWLACRISQRCAPVLVALLISANGMSFLPLVRRVSQEAWSSRFDVEYAREFAELVPRDALILTHNPNMFLLWGHSAAQMSKLTEYRDYFAESMVPRYRGGLYLHWSFWCNVPDPIQNAFAHRVTNEYMYDVVLERREQDYWYALLKITDKRNSGIMESEMKHPLRLFNKGNPPHGR